MKKTACFALLLALLLCLPLSGCAGRAALSAPTPVPTAQPTPAPTPTPEPTPEPTPAPVVLGGVSYGWETAELSPAAGSVSVAELLAALPQLPRLERVALTGWTLSTQEQLSLHAAAPAVLFDWTVDVQGVPCDSAQSVLILDGRTVDVAALEQALPLLPALTQVDMVGCGLDDETMYQLNQRWETVRFVWSTKLGSRPLRTDITYFRVSDKKQTGGLLSDETLDQRLKYFPELVALDVGHSQNFICRCDWVQYVPKLQVLIAADCFIEDLSPLAQLQELSYLEIFTNRKLTDLSPLAACASLQDVNLSYTPVTDLTPLNDLALSRLWLVGCDAIADEAVASYQAAHPDCELVLVRNSMDATGFGWRKHDRFYWMRDLFGAEYIP